MKIFSCSKKQKSWREMGGGVGQHKGHFWPDPLQNFGDLKVIWGPSGTLQNLTEFAFDLSMSSKVKCDGVSGFPIYDFLLVFNRPNSAPLRDMSLQSLGDLDFDPYSRRNVMFAIELSIYGFL